MDPSEKPDIDLPEPEAGSFIPYLLDDLVEMCISERKLGEEDQSDFREFTSFFAASANFMSHQALDTLDKDYTYFNPDSEMKVRECSGQELDEAESRVVQIFRTIAIDANYRKLTDAELEESFVAMSLIKLKTAVDLDEFDRVECYVRGSDFKTHPSKDWKFKEKQERIDVWSRVLLLMKFKEDDELTVKQLEVRKKANLPYLPGKIYIYQYKEVPKPDLEILFPNVRVSMNLKDRIMIAIPAAAATIGTIVKIFGKFLLILTAIALAFKLDLPGIDEEKAANPDIQTLAIVCLGVFGALLGLFFKQYTTVKNKRIGFMKEVSEHLFFRNIAMNKAVFNRIIDDGEDEDAKEAMLVYYHLLTHEGPPLNRHSLDEKIQDWMKDSFDTVIDFDIDGPVEKLKNFEGITNTRERKALIAESATGELQIPTLDEAKEIMDYTWDHAFEYSKPVGS